MSTCLCVVFSFSTWVTQSQAQNWYKPQCQGQITNWQIKFLYLNCPESSPSAPLGAMEIGLHQYGEERISLAGETFGVKNTSLQLFHKMSQSQL